MTDPIKLIKSNLEAKMEKINQSKRKKEHLTLPIINKINTALLKGFNKDYKVPY